MTPLPVAPSPPQVVDVGGGTGFCTQGVVKAGVLPANVTLLDQSPHQLAKARGKADLQGVTILEVGARAPEGPHPAASARCCAVWRARGKRAGGRPFDPP